MIIMITIIMIVIIIIMIMMAGLRPIAAELLAAPTPWCGGWVGWWGW